MKLFWTVEAINDRRAIYDYIEIDNPPAAHDFDELLFNKSRRLINHPKLGKPGRVKDTRELVISRSYVLIYDICGEAVRVLRILHTARVWDPELIIKEMDNAMAESRADIATGRFINETAQSHVQRLS